MKVTLSDIRLDVVLAVAPDGLEHPLRIPDRELRRWIKTHPKRQLDLVRALGSKTNGNYSRLVRLIKAWARARVAYADNPGSFVLECAVYQILAAHPANFSGPVDEAFGALLEGLHVWDFGRRAGLLNWGQPVIADPALPDLNVAQRWEHSSAHRVREKLELALRRVHGLHRSRWDDTEVRHWGALFGEPFPAPSTVARRIRQRAD